MFGMKQPPVWHWDLCQVRPETSETSDLTSHTSHHLQRAAASRQDTTRRTATAGDLAALVTATTDTTAITTPLRKKLQVGEFVELQTCISVDLQICRHVDLQTCKPLTELLECSAAENIKEKFETFLAEGLLDPLLPNILIQADNDNELKVEE